MRGTVEIPDSLSCLFTTQAERRDGSVVIEVPDSEVRDGDITVGESYEVALLSRSTDRPPESDGSVQDQPVQEGDVLDVEIEGIGDQGDGIARVGPGFVVIVPGTDLGDHVTIEITDVSDTVAFADVLEQEHSVT